MELDKLLTQVEKARRAPLQVCCRTPAGELITTTVIGGLGSLTGSVLGAIIVTVLPEIFRSLANYRMLLYGMAVVLIILFKPSGLYGYKEFSLKRTIHWFRTLPARLSGRKQAETTEKGGR